MAARLSMVMRGVCGVTVGGMGVMGGLLVVASLVVLGSFTMMTGGMLVMLGRLRMMLGALMLHSHGCSSPRSTTAAPPNRCEHERPRNRGAFQDIFVQAPSDLTDQLGPKPAG